MIVEEVANNRLLATMVTNHIGWVTSMYWHIPWTLLIFGGARRSVARVIAPRRRDTRHCCISATYIAIG